MVISRHALALAAALGGTACSSYNRATISDAAATPELPTIVVDAPAAVDTPPAVDAPPADTGTSPAYSCQRLCGRLQSVGGCSMTYTGCLTMCPSETRGFPASCNTRFDALIRCIDETPVARISCGAMAYPYLDCMVLNGEALSCARTAP